MRYNLHITQGNLSHHLTGRHEDTDETEAIDMLADIAKMLVQIGKVKKDDIQSVLRIAGEHAVEEPQ